MSEKFNTIEDAVEDPEDDPEDDEADDEDAEEDLTISLLILFLLIIHRFYISSSLFSNSLPEINIHYKQFINELAKNNNFYKTNKITFIFNLFSSSN